MVTAGSVIPARPFGRAVRVWLIAMAALIFAMVLVGGATRLTESGLSIVEWKPVAGTLPPLNETQWNAAFEAYKTIPQYRELNAGMSLSEFKTIFWWEWSHRLLGRFIGMAYFFPFLFFLWRGAFTPDLKKRLWIIFGLGGLQGAVGWWMVASGLTHRTEVSQYRLATHLMLALAIFAAIVWTLRRLSERPVIARPLPRLTTTSVVLAGNDLRADLFRRTRRRPAGRARLQHLAGDRRRIDPVRRAAVFRRRRGGAISSITRSPCSSAIAWSPMRCSRWPYCI